MGANHALILEILRENETVALPYLIPFMAPGKDGYDEAMTLIREIGADATAPLLQALSGSGPELAREITSYLSELFSQDPRKFIMRLFSGQVPDTDLMYELVHTSPEVVIPELIDIFQEMTGPGHLLQEICCPGLERMLFHRLLMPPE